jgi:hypothetical protein
MEKPATITNAQNLIYGTLGVSTICVVLNTVAGPVELPECLANVLLTGILAMLPYFIGRGYNIARMLYVITTCISALIIFGSSEMLQGSGRFDLYISVLLMPVELYVCGMLFREESRDWFKKKPATAK